MINIVELFEKLAA